MIKVTGKGNISAVVVADSESSVDGQRITTFLLTYHRYIHGEVMTHRLFSRNAMSSRAVPVNTMLDLVKTSPAMPIHWGKNQPGMQAKEECNNRIFSDLLANVFEGVEDSKYKDAWMDLYGRKREQAWSDGVKSAVAVADKFNRSGYHKQIVNRIIEPYQMIRVLVTATSFDNFFKLRFHEDAQPEIAELARCMLVAYKRSKPEVLRPGEWHTPFVDHWRDDSGGIMYGLNVPKGGANYPIHWLSEDEAIKISCSCAAQTSYRKADTSIEKAIAIYGKLVGSDPAHSSAFEHCATPMKKTNDIGDGDWEKGITHSDVNYEFWSNNFKGWIQYRALIPNNVCVSFDYSKDVDEEGLDISDIEEV